MLINNAGLLHASGIEDVTEEELLDCYRVNAMGPIFTVQAFLRHNLLQPGSLVANLTSLVRCFSCKAFLPTHKNSHEPTWHV